MVIDAIHGKPLLVYGDGENVRDWLFVKDNSKAIRQVMENGKIGEIYNIGGDNELTNNYVASLIAERFGVDIKYIEDRKGNDKRYSIDCTKIKDELGWKPVKKFEEGLDDTIKWYIEEEKRKNL
jgi:dTDP-glucose 4,6-dehydratase